MMLSRTATRRGWVTVNVVLSILTLMGVAALTIDVGRATVAAQRAQAVADGAALAAAMQLPDVDSANARLADLVTANNEANHWPPVTVNINADVTYYSAGAMVPDYGDLGGYEYAVKVTAHVDEQYGFARVAGLQEMNVVRTAVAKVDTRYGGSPSGLFAGENSPSATGIKVSRSHDLYVEADVHSNTKIMITGQSQRYRGLVEYRGRLTVAGQDIVLEHGSQEGDELAYPVDFTWDSFLPWDREEASVTINDDGRSVEIGHTHVLGDVIINGDDFTASNGVLLVEGNVIFNGKRPSLDNVTIVAKGTITFDDRCDRATAYTKDLLLMSLSSASPAITYDCASAGTEGALFAPNGTIKYHSGPGRDQHGSIIGKRIAITGNDYSIYGSAMTGGWNHVNLIK